MRIAATLPVHLYAIAHRLFGLWAWVSGLCLVGIGTSGIIVPLPRVLTSLESGAPLSLFASAGVSVVVVRSFRSDGSSLEAVYGRRRLWPFDGVALVGVAFTIACVSAISWPFVEARDVLVFARNTSELCAIGLVAARLVNSDRSTVVPVAMVLLTGTLGRGDNGRPAWWALLLHEPTRGATWVSVAVSILAIAASMIGFRRP
jgi:hypothetical protein